MVVGEKGVRPETKRENLVALLKNKRIVRVIEVHNAISALVTSSVSFEVGDCEKVESREFDALWASSLTESTSKGLPDIELVSLDSRLSTIEQIVNASNKPLIVDGDTGRDLYSFEYFLKRLELLGVSAIVIEDKTFPKRNSLSEDSIQNLEDPKVFADKIRTAKRVLVSDNFLVFARLESMIAGGSIEETLLRAKTYLLAGADGILIHSKEKSPKNVLEFARRYNDLCEKMRLRKPLICIPTTYCSIRERELEDNGFNVVIYANHPMRAAIKAMEEVSKLILANQRAFETEPFCVSVNKIFDLVGFTKIKQRDKEQSRARVIIPAAGKPKEEIAKDLPIAMLPINGKSILQRQLDVLNRCGISDTVVIRGYEKDRFNINCVKYCDVDDYDRGSFYTLYAARQEMKNGFILSFSDIIFEQSIINRLLKIDEDIVLVVDATYPYHRHEVDKDLDLVISKQRDRSYREPLTAINEVAFIGKKIKKEIATHEFIGIAKFSPQGAENLIEVYEDCLLHSTGRFHESQSIKKASIIDMIQEMIGRGFKVHCVETHKGWMEIHNKSDYELAKEILRDISLPILS